MLANYIATNRIICFDSLNPEYNEPWAVVPVASAIVVIKAVESAKKAFE